VPYHRYNDFACVQFDQPWDPAPDRRSGELFRIEAKSMRLGADESKGHFDELRHELGERDLLLVLLWEMEELDPKHSYPRIVDHFIGSARSIAALRDQLHIARGGRFVDRVHCPAGCSPSQCSHHGEPLNAAGNRERRKGPGKSDPRANFGGLVRMLGADDPSARNVLRHLRATDDEVHRYVSFVHRNYPRKELTLYRHEDWVRAASALRIGVSRLSPKKVIAKVRERADYMGALRNLTE
jgi:hypothetical protein